MLTAGSWWLMVECKDCGIKFTTENVLRLHRKNRHSSETLDDLIDAIWPVMKQEYGDMLAASDDVWRASIAHVLTVAGVRPLSLGSDGHVYFLEETVSNDTGSQNYVEVYEREDGEWDWREKAPRGNLPDEIVSTSGGQGYTNDEAAYVAARRENPGLEIRVVPRSE